MITTTSSSLLSNSKHMEALGLLLMVLGMVIVRHQPTVKAKLMVKMAMVVIMQVQLNLVMARRSQTQHQDMTSSSKDIIQPMVMSLTQHLMVTPLRMEHRVKPIKHLHLDSHTMLEVNPSLTPIIHLKLLVRRVMEYPHLHRVVTEPKHLLVMLVMVHRRLKNHQLLSQCMHNRSSHPALKVVATLRLGILIPRLHLRKPVILRQIQVHKDLHHQVIQHLSQGMQPHLMEPHQQLNLAMGNSSLLHTTALMLLDIPNLQRTHLMVLPVVIHVALMIQLHHLNLHSPVELPKHRLPVDEQSSFVVLLLYPYNY